MLSQVAAGRQVSFLAEVYLLRKEDSSSPSLTAAHVFEGTGQPVERSTQEGGRIAQVCDEKVGAAEQTCGLDAGPEEVNRGTEYSGTGLSRSNIHARRSMTPAVSCCISGYPHNIAGYSPCCVDFNVGTKQLGHGEGLHEPSTRFGPTSKREF